MDGATVVSLPIETSKDGKMFRLAARPLGLGQAFSLRGGLSLASLSGPAMRPQALARNVASVNTRLKTGGIQPGTYSRLTAQFHSWSGEP
jgi:hypothetical protein